MRIVQLTPGSGDQFYCENCLRDAALARALRAQGADLLLVPMYLPLSLDRAEPLERTEVFFGGVGVYLRQKSALFCRAPRWLDRLLDSGLLLRAAGRRAGLTNARQLGEMTLSMLRGPRDRQAKEIDRLAEFLSQPENRPDVVVLSNLLLAGLARPIKDRLGCKLVCLLQDEDGFVDGLGEPWSRQVWDQMARLVPLFDCFISVSHYYAKVMQQRLPIPSQKIEVIPPGLEVSLYQPAGPADKPTIGFLGRMSEENGFDWLEELMKILIKSEGLDVHLRICGGMSSVDKKRVEGIMRGFAGEGLSARVKLENDFRWEVRHRTLQRLTLLCSPSKTAPAYAMNVLEAMACGVPFAAPNHGVYPEWAQLTGAGVLYEPNTVSRLIEAVRPLLDDPAQCRRLGENGRRAVLEHFDIQKTAGRMLCLFEQMIETG